MYNIKRGIVNLVTVRPSSGRQSQKIMGENDVNITFTLVQPIDFKIGDTIDVFGQTYTLNTLPSVNKISTIQHEYTCKFEGQNYELTKVRLMFLDASNELKEGDFSLMGTASNFIDLLVKNMNRVQAGWIMGDVDVTEFKNLSFSNETCLGALNTLSEEFKCEFWVINKTIHFTKKGAVSGLSFQYGKGNGLTKIIRQNKDNSNIVTRLYAFGSTKNIPSNYRNFANRLRIPLSANAGKVYVEQGVSQYGVIEHVEIFEDVFPNREGVVSAIDVASPLKFSDNTLDFDVNAQLLPGVTAKIVFNTGQLAGYEFDISSYNHATKQFKININESEKALVVPSNLLKPAIGDKYVITDINMPASYITAAESKLLAKATDYLNANAISRVNYSVECDKLHFKRENINVSLGSYVNIADTDFNINASIRVIGLSRDLIDSFQYSLELSESVKPSGIIRSVIQQQKIDNALTINNLLDPAKARRNWRDSQELLNLVFDPEGDYYTDKIKPLSIETTMLSVGARSQQFELNGLVVEPNFQGSVNEFRSSAAILDHFSIDPTQVVSWNIAASSYSGLITTSAYYIYAKCDKTTNNGTIFLSQAKITFNQDANYYHFLLGVLHSAASLVAPRGLSLTYGQTTVNGKFIKTGKIQSQDGNTFFDLDNGTISGRISFLPEGGGSPQLLGSVISNLNTSVSSAQTAATNAQNTAGIAVNDAATAAGIANGKGKVITQNLAPSVADQNAVTLWIDTTNGANTPKRWTGTVWAAITDKVAIDAANNAISALNSANIAQLTANEAKGVTDNFTIINGGLIYSNTLKVGSFGVELAGITAVGTLSNSIRFWAGSTYENRNTAPFRVQQDGKVYMTNAVISGEVNASSGTIAGVQISAGNNFNLDGSAVKIIPNEGVRVLNNGYLDTSFAKLFIPHDLGVNRKVSFKFKTTAGSGGSPPPAGAQYLYSLLDVAIASPLNGQALVYNTSLAKWQNQSVVSDLSNYYTKAQSDGLYSVLAHSHAYSAITGKPTLLSQFTNDLGNYGNWITATQGNALYSLLAHVHTFASLTSKPTTIAGYGITDFNSLGDARFKAVGYTPSNAEVLTALGFTPYNATNPTGYITAASLSSYQLASGLGSAAFLNASTAATVNTVVQRTVSGHIQGNYINMVDNSVASGVTGIIVKQGDNLYRTGTAGAIQSFLGLGSNAYNSTAFLPLTGGTLTGALNGTLSFFSGAVSAATAQIGNWSQDGTWARFGHINFNTTTNYGFVQQNTGQAHISGTDIRFHISGVTRYVLDSAGNNQWTGFGTFGVGLISPIIEATTNLFIPHDLGTNRKVSFKFKNTAGTGGSLTTNFLPLTGGILTGALTGTSATFSGNVGIGTAINAGWGSSIFRTLQFGNGASDFLIGRSDGVNQIQLGSNAYFDNTNWRYASTGPSTRYIQSAGSHQFQRAVSGTLGGTISWLDNLIIDSAGNYQFFGGATFYSLGTGTVYSNGGYLTNTNPSDSTLKNTITPLSYGLAEIMQLKPKTFYYNSDSKKSSLKYGFIAQDVKLIMPDIVRKISKDDDKLGLESDGIYVTLVKAMQEQQVQIEQLQAKLTANNTN